MKSKTPVTIVRAQHTDNELAVIAARMPALIRETGPVSYDYQFGADGRLLNAVVALSWNTPGTFFSREVTTLATDNHQLAGMAMAFPGKEFYERKSMLVERLAANMDLMDLDPATIHMLTQRAEKASYLNAHIPLHAYYLLAIAVEPEFRNRSIGKALLASVLDDARAGGFLELQLDVLSDNPAVDFYLAFGFRIIAEIRSPALVEEADFPIELRMGYDL